MVYFIFPINCISIIVVILGLRQKLFFFANSSFSCHFLCVNNLRILNSFQAFREVFTGFTATGVLGLESMCLHGHQFRPNITDYSWDQIRDAVENENPSHLNLLAGREYLIFVRSKQCLTRAIANFDSGEHR